jgi:hypothetical protein
MQEAGALLGNPPSNTTRVNKYSGRKIYIRSLKPLS